MHTWYLNPGSPLETIPDTRGFPWPRADKSRDNRPKASVLLILTASSTCLWADSPGSRDGRAGEGWAGREGVWDTKIKGLRAGKGFANWIFCLPFGGGAREASLGRRRGRGKGRRIMQEEEGEGRHRKEVRHEKHFLREGTAVRTCFAQLIQVSFLNNEFLK